VDNKVTEACKRMKYFLHLIILSIISLSSFTLASEQSLRTSYYHQNVAPQLFFDANGQPTSGILFDITHAIAKQLDMTLEMLPIPRKRVEQSLIINLIDMHCVANPKWYQAKALQWSSAIYQNPDVLINRQGLKKLADLSEFNMLKIGTTFGYIYPELTSYINNNNIQAIASLTPTGSYTKYRNQHVSGFVSAFVEASYFSKDSNDSVILINNNDIHCALAPSMEQSRVERINEAIKQLKTSGEVTAILKKYKGVPESMNQAHDRITD